MRAKPKPKATEPSVQPMTLLASRELVTIEADHAAWKGAGKLRRKTFAATIVRLRPPPSASDEEVAELRRFCEERGAVRVVVAPRARANLLPEHREHAAEADSRSTREVVEAMVAESPNAEALLPFCERVMSEAGL